jgi:hypothetical protein
LPEGPPYTLTPTRPSAGLAYLPASPHRWPNTSWVGSPRRGSLSKLGSAWSRKHWYWNINQLSIDYVFRPRLRSRLTLGGLAFPRNPWAFGGRVSHPSLATHAGILTRVTSTTRLRGRFSRRTTLPYQSLLTEKFRSFGIALSPVTLSARNHLTSELLRTLSRVAASKPTSWLSSRLHILFHLAQFRDLSWRSGLFPFRPRSLSPVVSLPCSKAMAFGVWLSSVTL